jgi:hypothetical protein
MSRKTTLIKIECIDLHIWCSGSVVDPYAHTWISKCEYVRYSPPNYRAFNWKFHHPMMASGKKVWRWSNETPKWLKKTLSFLHDMKHRNDWNFSGEYDSKGEMIIDPHITKWAFMKQYFFAKPDYSFFEDPMGSPQDYI